MSDSERYADVYLNYPDRQQWLADTFASMTFAEYQGFLDYCFEEINLAAAAKDGAELWRVRGLLMALARKNLEVAHFMDGLTDEQRTASLHLATSNYELAKRFYPEDTVPAVEAAWAASLDEAARFGWPSAVFYMLAPHRVFRDHPELEATPQPGGLP